MRYNQPFDKVEPDASYVQGNPAVGLQGSIPPAAAIEFPQREIVNTILAVALADPSNSDLAQLSKAVRFMQILFAVDFGVPNAIKIKLDPQPRAWTTSMPPFFIQVANTSSTAAPSCEIVGLAEKKTIVKRNGGALQTADLLAGALILCVYDGVFVRILNMTGSELPTIPESGIVPNWTFNIQLMTSSGGADYNPVYTKTPGCHSAIVLATGGGGAGGSSNGATSLVGAGGEAGSTALATFDMTSITTVPCVIGRGGVPSPSGAATNTNAGAGGQTSFGIGAIAPGGLGGLNSVMNGTAVGGTVGGTGLIMIPGEPGQAVVATLERADPGRRYGMRAGNGGSSIWGGPGIGMDAQPSGQSGAAATGYGSGGGGGDSGRINAVPGGSGRDGVIMVIEFGLTTS